jgi:hypothetical protein
MASWQIRPCHDIADVRNQQENVLGCSHNPAWSHEECSIFCFRKGTAALSGSMLLSIGDPKDCRISRGLKLPEEDCSVNQGSKSLQRRTGQCFGDFGPFWSQFMLSSSVCTTRSHHSGATWSSPLHCHPRSHPSPNAPTTLKEFWRLVFPCNKIISSESKVSSSPFKRVRFQVPFSSLMAVLHCASWEDSRCSKGERTMKAKGRDLLLM